MDGQSRESPLREYLSIVRRQRALVLSTVILVPLAALVFSLAQSPSYEASARVLLNQQVLSESITPNPGAGLSPDTADRVSATQAQLARVPAVARAALAPSPVSDAAVQRFLGASSVSADPNSDLLTFTVAAPSAHAAERLATRYATAYSTYRRAIATAAIHQASAGLTTRLHRLGANGLQASAAYANLSAAQENLKAMGTLQSSATRIVETPTGAAKVRPQTFRNVALGAALGLLIGLALAFARAAVNPRVSRSDDVANTLGLPLIGRVWDASNFTLIPRAAMTIESFPAELVEAYRSLRKTVDVLMSQREWHVTRGNGTYSLAVTSPTDGDRRAEIAANLGVALARAGKRVAILDASPGPAKGRANDTAGLFRLTAPAGFRDVLRGEATVGETLVEIELAPTPRDDPPKSRRRSRSRPGLWVLPAGSTHPSDGDITESARLDHVLESLLDRVDVLLVNVPPLLGHGDPLELAQHLDAMLVVVGANQLDPTRLSDLAALLRGCPMLQLGFVFSRSSLDRRPYTRTGLALASPPRETAI